MIILEAVPESIVLVPMYVWAEPENLSLVAKNQTHYGLTSVKSSHSILH